MDLAPAAQPTPEGHIVFQRHQSARLRADAARPGVRELPGPGGVLPRTAGLLGRARRPMGRGPRGAGRAADRERSPRQYRRLLAASAALRTGAGSDLVVPDALDRPDGRDAFGREGREYLPGS